MDKIGVCILNYNSGAKSLECLASARLALAGYEHEIVVVDNASRDDSIDLLRTGAGTAVVLSNARNVGYAAGNNVGARHLMMRGCTFLLFLNPDVSCSSSTIDVLCHALRDTPRAGCAGGIASSAVPGVALACGRRKPSFHQKLILYGLLRMLPISRSVLAPLCSRLAKEHYVLAKVGEPPRQVYAISGACLMIPSSAFQDVGGFDEHTFLYEEELILSERLAARGWVVLACPSAVYVHEGGYSTKSLLLSTKWSFIWSEQYLVRVFYEWSMPTRLLLLAVRVSEWLMLLLVRGLLAMKTLCRA
jgi:GT2 family glycosyltransferase